MPHARACHMSTLPLVRRLTRPALSWVLALATFVAVACSPGNEIRRPDGSRGGDGGAGPGSGSSSSVAIGTLTGNGGSIVGSGAGGSSGMSDAGLTRCMGPADCKMNELCIDGTCRPIGSGCMTDADCLGDQRC